MMFEKQSIPDVILCKPKVFGDERGYFVETFQQAQFEEAVGHAVYFCQDNESKSCKGVLRGLHFQKPPYAQSKLVRVIQGSVLDVVVDIRAGSPWYGKHIAVEINEENKHQLFVPRGFAHGFVVLSDTAIFAYKVDNYYAPDHDSGLAFDDEDLSINWILNSDVLQLSNKDKIQPKFKELEDCFYYNQDYYKRR